jgi:selenocysteine lyase/cysteine desulfurase
MTQADFSDRFPVLREMVFLNHAGVAPLSGPAADALRGFAEQASRRAYVGSGWYETALELKRKIARLIHARGPHEIALVPNTSTGLAMVANGLAWRRGQSVVITDAEFPANRGPWEDLRRHGVTVIEARQGHDGRLFAEDVADCVTNHTRVVSISHVQYATGYRIDLRPISRMIHMARGYLCVDGIQSVGVLPVDVEAMGIDFLAADGHKWLLGPEGCGFLYVNEGLIEMLHPAVVGWMNFEHAFEFERRDCDLRKDARRFEPGSYNVPGLLALDASVGLLLEVGEEEVWRRVEALTQRLCEGLAAKGYRVFSPRRPDERSGIVSFSPPAPELRATPAPQRIVADLERAGVVLALRGGRLRASPHFYNTAEQIDRLIEALP